MLALAVQSTGHARHDGGAGKHQSLVNLPAVASSQTSIFQFDALDFCLPPNVPLVEQAGQVAPPIAPCPAKALVQELSIVLQCCLDFAFWVVLHVCLPTMRNHPAGDEIVIISI